MNQDLESLKKLVLEGGYDDEDKKSVLQLEHNLQEAVSAEKLTLHPAIKAYLDYLKAEISRCNLILNETEVLPEDERKRVYLHKKECTRFLSIFEDQRTSVEQEIKQLLNVAISQRE